MDGSSAGSSARSRTKNRGPLQAFCDYTGIDSKPLKRAIKDALDQYVDSYIGSQTEHRRLRPPFWEGVPMDIRADVRAILSDLLSSEKKEAKIESTSEYETILAAYLNETLRSRYYNKGGGKDGKETPSQLAVPVTPGDALISSSPAENAPEVRLPQGEDVGSVGIEERMDPSRSPSGGVTSFRPW